MTDLVDSQSIPADNRGPERTIAEELRLPRIDCEPSEKTRDRVLSAEWFRPVHEFLAQPASELSTAPAAAVRQIREILARAEIVLNSEEVSTEDFHPRSATRSLDEWRREDAALQKIGGALKEVLPSESAEPPLSEAADPCHTLLQELSAALTQRDPSISALLKCHMHPEAYPFLDSNHRAQNTAALAFWEFPRDDRESAQHFLDALSLERERPGAGAKHLLRMVPPKQGAQHEHMRGPSLGARIKAFMQEDWFQFPRIWRGEFSFIKPVHRRKVTSPLISGPAKSNPDRVTTPKGEPTPSVRS